MIKIGSFQFLPTDLHGLCFGYCFSGPLPPRSLANGPPIGVRFQESLVIRLHSEIHQIHLGIEAQSVTTLLPLGDCHIRKPTVCHGRAELGFSIKLIYMHRYFNVSNVFNANILRCTPYEWRRCKILACPDLVTFSGLPTICIMTADYPG